MMNFAKIAKTTTGIGFSLFLTGCINLSPTYLPSNSTKPLVNVEEEVASQIDVQASSEALSIENISAHAVSVSYKLFWYDEEGVTQMSDYSQKTSWNPLWLEPQQKENIILQKPTPESERYRIYVKPE